jgi:hypothetical protein
MDCDEQVMHYPVREVPDVMTDNQNMSLHSSVPPNLNQTWNVHGARSHIHYQKYSRRTCIGNGLVWHMDMYLFCAWVQVYTIFLSY